MKMGVWPAYISPESWAKVTDDSSVRQIKVAMMQHYKDFTL